MALPETIRAQKSGIIRKLDPQENVYRLEIDEFIQNKPMTNLFLLALEALQDNRVLYQRHTKEAPSPEDLEKYWWSFYTIAGLHGFPREPWGHVHKAPPRDVNEAGEPYYCQHGTVCFPTWHRPYIMMMEQAVFNKMYEIANQFTSAGGKEIYLQAVRRFRFPYWDPWMPRNVADPVRNWGGMFAFPTIFRAQEVFVRRPGNPHNLERIDNPLYRYKMPDQSRLKEEAKVKFNRNGFPESGNEMSIRAPSGSDAVKNNELVLDYALRSQAVEEHSKFLQMFLGMEDSKSQWDAFSNHSWAGANPATSLESWHDDIHFLISEGRGKAAGNMYHPEVAAFDPIFWLHHCNIDRIMALYQALHPDTYVPFKGDELPGRTENIDTPLKPFFHGKGDEDLWNSRHAQDWKQCGFAVPGTKDVDPKALRKSVGEYINSTYLWIAGKEAPPSSLGFPKYLDRVEALIGKTNRPAPPDFQILMINKETSSLMKSVISLGPDAKIVSEHQAVTTEDITTYDKSAYPKGALEGNKQRTWNVHLTVLKFAFDGSFTVNVFLGEVDDDSSDGYLLLDNQVGFSGIFASSAEARCDNCDAQRRAGTRYADVVPLTTMLVGCLKSQKSPSGPLQELRVLESLEPEFVVPFLQKNLEWRISSADSIPKTEQEVIDAGLDIKVMDRWYNLPTAEEPLGSYGPAMLHAGVTKGKAGGIA